MDQAFQLGGGWAKLWNWVALDKNEGGVKAGGPSFGIGWRTLWILVFQRVRSLLSFRLWLLPCEFFKNAGASRN